MKWSIVGDRPIYQQLFEQMTERIVGGIYQAGEKIPAVRDLASEAGVNPNTMQRALSELEREGLLYSQRTNGRFVTEDKERIMEIRNQLAESRIADFLGSMSMLGFTGKEIIELLEKNCKQGEE